MLPSSLDAMLKLSKTTSPRKLENDLITLYCIYQAGEEVHPDSILVFQADKVRKKTAVAANIGGGGGVDPPNFVRGEGSLFSKELKCALKNTLLFITNFRKINQKNSRKLALAVSL